NIIADSNLNNGSCEGITVNGEITSLTVKNRIIGHPAGATFSLFICPQLSNSEFESDHNCKVYPNPFRFETKLHISNALNNATIMCYNMFGQNIKKIENISGTDISINRESLESGIYILQIIEKDNYFNPIKLIVKD
ncbi:MAG TPA: T9SS type A sorting domain-containing protein, partial [Flavobacterium sp.]|nr:T9SS type A sorting domain-containing protein [Flavobacterium sp.]